MKKIELSKEVLSHSLQLTEEQSAATADAITHYNKFCQTVPKTFDWTFNSDIALLEKIKHQQTVSKINESVWKDRFNSTRACLLIFLNRSNAMFFSLSRNILQEDYISSAVIARALLELCMWHSYYSHLIERSVADIKQDPSVLLIDFTELEQIFTRLIFGSNVTSEKELKQEKVMKILKETSKTIGRQYPLERTYDVLCEYTHPNVGGNNLFVNFDINAGLKPTKEVMIKIHEYQKLKKSDNLSVALCDCIEFCCVATTHSSTKYQEAADQILNKFVKRNTIH